MAKSGRKPAVKKPAKKAGKKGASGTTRPSPKVAAKTSKKPAGKKTSGPARKSRAAKAPAATARKPLSAAKKTAAKKTASKNARAAAAKSAALKTAAGKTRKVVAKSRPAETRVSVRKLSKQQAIEPNRVISNAAKGKSIHGKIDVSNEQSGHLTLEKEAFMNDRQRDYFRGKLLTWKEDILRESRETLVALQTENENHPDFADRASSETDRAIELRARDRQRKLISKIDSALSRIDEGTYGYCEETGEPIAIKRLDARPIATLSIEAQERHERRERVYRDD